MERRIDCASCRKNLDLLKSSEGYYKKKEILVIRFLLCMCNLVNSFYSIIRDPISLLELGGDVPTREDDSGELPYQIALCIVFFLSLSLLLQHICDSIGVLQFTFSDTTVGEIFL